MFTCVQEFTLCFSGLQMQESIYHLGPFCPFRNHWLTLLFMACGRHCWAAEKVADSVWMKCRSFHQGKQCKVEGGASDWVIMRRDIRNCHMEIAPENFGLLGEEVLYVGLEWESGAFLGADCGEPLNIWDTRGFIFHTLARMKPLVKVCSQAVLFY